MATNLIKSDAAFTEAPASWNTRYITPEGFVCQITIRGENGKDLLDKAGIALVYLLTHGFTPEQKLNHNNKGQGNICQIHRCEMKRFEKDGRAWFSHKTEDGKWCRGKQK
jgi:hypothetical protein